MVKHGVGVSDQRALNQLINLYCVFPIPDGDAKRHKVYTGFGQWVPYVQSESSILYSLHRNARSRDLQAGRERELVLGLYVEPRGLLEMLISSSEGARVFIHVFMREFVGWA